MEMERVINRIQGQLYDEHIGKSVCLVCGCGSHMTVTKHPIPRCRLTTFGRGVVTFSGVEKPGMWDQRCWRNCEWKVLRLWQNLPLVTRDISVVRSEIRGNLLVYIQVIAPEASSSWCDHGGFLQLRNLSDAFHEKATPEQLLTAMRERGGGHTIILLLQFFLN